MPKTYPGVIKINDLAIHLATTLRHRTMGSEHLLFAVASLDSKDFPPVSTLHQLGLTPGEILREVRELVGTSDAPAGCRPARNRRHDNITNLVDPFELSLPDLARQYLLAILADAQKDSEGTTYQVVRNLTHMTPHRLSAMF